ncbi:MAG: hypothetical protein E7620_02715 [Ruminococcaceae bacterium]|nr:hypothetical protein [Oscillospiraceae bacterium]
MSQAYTLVEYMQRLGFPAEAINELTAIRDRLSASTELDSLMKDAQKSFLNGGEGDFQAPLAKIAALSGERRESVDLVMMVECLPVMRERYRERNLPEEIFWDTAKDLTYKMIECHNNRGVWGSFVTFWFPEFFRLERFALGRLQFEHKAFPYEGVDGVEKGQVVYNCHIPSSGSLPPESVDDAFRRAKEFYAHELNGKPMPVYCSSWMLYPPHVELFPEGSNLRRFAERFTLVDAVADETNHDFWRIFNRPWTSDICLEELPEDTALRRAFKSFLMAGNTMGSGKCLLWLN